MNLTGLHFLLTLQCVYACDHCFLWGGPDQSGVMTLDFIQAALDQAAETPGLESVYFEGGEPFLYQPVLVGAVNLAVEHGLEVGVVTNAYWATTRRDALAWLEPLAGKLADLSISADAYHGSADGPDSQARIALDAAERLNIPAGLIAIDPVEALADSPVRFRGRAAAKLAPKAPGRPAEELTACPDEDLAEPGRVHLDPFGNIHVCQGLVIGNINRRPLARIAAEYDPQDHPIVGPLLQGGPRELARRFGFEPAASYGDACHLCYSVRDWLRERFPEQLTPPGMYGRIDRDD